MGIKRTQQDKAKGQPRSDGGQNVQLHTEQLSSQKYFKGQFTSSVYDRAERIAIASHIIMDRIQGHEETKSHILSRVRYLLDAVSVSDILRDEERVWTVLGHLRGIVTGYETLRFSGALSHTIAALLVQAIDDLASILSAASKSSSVGVSITEAFFEPVSQAQQPRSHDVFLRQERPTVTSTASSRSVSNKKTAVSHAVRHSSVHQGRRDRIIDILRVGPATITEVAAKMPDCGPKTVQRELAALVKSRAIVAKGERRWRTYSLVED